ncbi:MAG: hypothetical protein GY943_14545 [Chloroflexi bacterium]|nr:hypothetical protein [Chloroflexota bacterium]
MSYNESPLGPSPKVVAAIRETAVSIGDYPPMGDATAVSQAILPFGVMVRPLSAPGLENCLRISISTQAGNHQFMHGLEQILSRKDLIE